MVPLCFLFLVATTTATVYDCPVEWVTIQKKCYNFVHHPMLPYKAAAAACQLHGAALVSINDLSEHNFISGWLKRHDPNRKTWYTSGVDELMEDKMFKWKGDGSYMTNEQKFWITPREWNKTGRHIVYTFHVNSYGWTKRSGSAKLSYICEISQAEAYRIVQHHRGFDYGMDLKNPNDIKKGPKFIVKPESMVVVGKLKNGFVECLASGNPQPTYRWYKGDGVKKLVTSQMDSRYTLTNGRFTFSQPNEAQDAGYYYCVATNQLGSILSSPVQVSFGFLGEFSNVRSDTVVADAYEGTMIVCSTIQYRPALNYQWIKGHSSQFVRPEKQTYIFISNNGRLYFSEVTRADAGMYMCIVSLAGETSSAIGTSQPPSRTSNPIPLTVVARPPKVDWGPVIQNDFISVYPQPPLRGHNLKLECFAYGSGPLTYSWYREEKPLASKVKFSDHNRVLSIPQADMEDQGIYVCVVKRGQAARVSTSYSLVLGAKPFFIFPLADQHGDVGSQLTWHCEARAEPAAQYAWYKNAVPLKPLLGEIDVTRNILKIRKLQPARDTGMYQCSATNKYGTTFSSAQLRILAFKPTFKKKPIGPFIYGASGGNVTFVCQPEAAPLPEIRWLKNSNDLRLKQGDKTGRIHQLLNGNLEITNLQSSDQGRYTCIAKNSMGEDSSTSFLKIADATRITHKPSNTVVLVNETAFLSCQASHNKILELVYVWKFNGRVIDLESDPYFSRDSNLNIGGITIRQAQFRHAGRYQCIARTSLDQARASAILTVAGPPGEPGGVHADQKTITSHSLQLLWTKGVNRGKPVYKYTIEANTNFDPKWLVIATNIHDSSTLIEGDIRRTTLIEGLNPGTSYSFRILAINQYGIGDPSLPSASYHTTAAAPTKAPDSVGGGGGSVGDLTLDWKPLSPNEQCGPGIGYIVYWRRQTNKDLKWEKKVLYGNVGEFVVTVGSENYFLEYETKVQSFNDLGSGPNSTIEVVFSAEDLPIAVPINIHAEGYNGTALEIFWDPVPNTREAVRGQILGYQVNYWLVDAEDPVIHSISFQGQTGSGIFIGLESDTNYWSNVQVFNSAGLGPRSEDAFQEVLYAAPSIYPTEVKIFSHGPGSMQVTWRGISYIGVGEMNIAGYKLRVYPATEDVRNAVETEVGLVSEAVIRNLEKNILYKLRILAFSEGGDGKMSEALFFTLGGNVQYDPSVSEILASGTQLHASCILLCLSSFAKLLLH